MKAIIKKKKVKSKIKYKKDVEFVITVGGEKMESHWSKRMKKKDYDKFVEKWWDLVDDYCPCGSLDENGHLIS